MESLLPVFLTVVSGVATFVVGQIIIKIFVDPIQDLRKLIGEIAHCLINNAGSYFEPAKLSVEQQAKVAADLGNLAARLHAQLRLVPWHCLLSRIGVLTSTKRITIASRNLISISNAMSSKRPNNGILNAYSAQRVRDALGIYMDKGDRLNPAEEDNMLNSPAD